MSSPSPQTAFVSFFDELRGVFLEREALFAQIELALLAREHVLVTGPPGTAKSAVANAVLSRIVDEASREPSLFAKQLSESTVQTDLVGQVDFKVLTETGRTRHLTEDGMLGATHAFLDEVFDGRDMLLRSILNVLHERELKEGRRVTTGKFECAVMTTNRYLSEVLTRSPELLVAFADRLSFVCFVPKSFARGGSRAAMLARAGSEKQPRFKAMLTLQQLAALQRDVEQVTVSSQLAEAVELLSDELERELGAHVAKLPDYVPTKYFSHRTVVKAVWALKAAVVRDRLYRRPGRALCAEVEDLEALRSFFLLGGPPLEETERLLAHAADPRERAQLEIIRLEQQAFSSALTKVRGQLGSGVQREASELDVQKLLARAQAVHKTFVAPEAVSLARTLLAQLRPGPRHPDNRVPLVAAARLLVFAVEAQLRAHVQGEARAPSVLGAGADALALVQTVPELSELISPLTHACEQACSWELTRTAQSAEGSAFDSTFAWDALLKAGQAAQGELGGARLLAERVCAVDSERGGALLAQEREARRRTGAALHAGFARAFRSAGPPPAQDGEVQLEAAAKLLAEAEHALSALGAEEVELRRQLLEPLAERYLESVVRKTPFKRIDVLTAACQRASEALRRVGVPDAPLFQSHRETLELRLREYASALEQSASSAHAPPESDAHSAYRKRFAAAAVPDGEALALRRLEERVRSKLAAEIRSAVYSAELSSLSARVRYLESWYAQVQAQLPKLSELARRDEAEKAFDRLVRSRFPWVAVKEGELARLQLSLSALEGEPEHGEGVKSAKSALQRLSEDFGLYSQRLLEARSSLP